MRKARPQPKPTVSVYDADAVPLVRMTLEQRKKYDDDRRLELTQVRSTPNLLAQKLGQL